MGTRRGKEEEGRLGQDGSRGVIAGGSQSEDRDFDPSKTHPRHEPECRGWSADRNLGQKPLLLLRRRRCRRTSRVHAGGVTADRSREGNNRQRVWLQPGFANVAKVCGEGGGEGGGGGGGDGGEGVVMVGVVVVIMIVEEVWFLFFTLLNWSIARSS
jgi:hypothetical protein